MPQKGAVRSAGRVLVDDAYETVSAALTVAQVDQVREYVRRRLEVEAEERLAKKIADFWDEDVA